MATTQVNGKAKIRPLATPKPLNRSSSKVACLIMLRMAPGTQNFSAIGLGVSAPQIRDFECVAQHQGGRIEYLM